MRRILLLSLLAYSLLILGLITRRGEIISLVIPFLLFLAAAFRYAPAEPHLRITRRLSATCISPGKEVEVILSVVNEGSALEEILLEDQLPAALEVVAGKTRILASLPANSHLDLTYTVRGHRGSYVFQQAQVTVRDSLALFHRSQQLPVPGLIYIKPEVWRLRSITIRPIRTHLYTGPIPSRQGGTGGNFLEIREYSPGDPLRRINWLKTSRNEDRLFTNQFEQERVADVGIILDARQQTDIVPLSKPVSPLVSLPSLFEYGVRATAALADVFLRDGHRVGMLIYGRGQQGTFPGYGKAHRERILRDLARARTGDNMALESLVYLPTRFFPPKSQIVLVSAISPAGPPILTGLLAHGYQLLVVSPDPISFEMLNLPKNHETVLAWRLARLERVMLLRKLQRYGIRVVNWPVNRSLANTLDAALRHAPVEYRRLGIGL